MRFRCSTSSSQIPDPSISSSDGLDCSLEEPDGVLISGLHTNIQRREKLTGEVDQDLVRRRLAGFDLPTYANAVGRAILTPSSTDQDSEWILDIVDDSRRRLIAENFVREYGERVRKKMGELNLGKAIISK